MKTADWIIGDKKRVGLLRVEAKVKEQFIQNMLNKMFVKWHQHIFGPLYLTFI